MADDLDEIKIILNDPLETWRKCGGYYKCPKDYNGLRIGPLVAYRGKYQGFDGRLKRYVGEEYYNFAKVEEYPHTRRFFAEGIMQLLNSRINSGSFNLFLAAPMGGIMLATELGSLMKKRAIFAEKKDSDMVLDRHEVKSQDRIVIIEDVCNNFSTTETLMSLVESYNGRVVAIACALNRSFVSDISIYPSEAGMAVPVFSLICKPTQQYEQEDPEVIDDIATGNIIWETKEEWAKLKKIMEYKNS